MVARVISTLVIIGSAIGVSGGAPTVDIAAAAAAWDSHFVLTGTKTEPTYIEHVRLERDGDVFILEGGAPAGMAASREVLLLQGNGALTHLECPMVTTPCDDGQPPSGFLASAVILDAVRHRRLSGRFPFLLYGGLTLVCIPADRLGIRDAVLDPCIDVASGAVVAQRHRRSGEFDGPTLDAWSVKIATPRRAPFEH